MSEQKTGNDTHDLRIQGTMPQEVIEHLFMHFLDPEDDNVMARALRNFLAQMTGAVTMAMTPEEIEKQFGRETLDMLERQNLKNKSTGGD